jgi:hypothetical protein
MNSERHHSLTFPRKRHGATSAWTLISAVVCDVAPQLRSPSAATRRRIPVEAAVWVPSLGAQLRLSSCRSARAASRVAVRRGAAARSDTTGLPPSRLRRSAQWPNNSLGADAGNECTFTQRQQRRGTPQALGCKPRMRMSSELHLRRKPCSYHHGAKSVLGSSIVVICHVASQLRSFSVATLHGILLSGSVGVASFGAQLRSSLCRSVRAALSAAVQRGGAVRPESSGLHPSHLPWSARLPNNSPVPKPVTNALSLCVGSGAAHLRR